MVQNETNSRFIKEQKKWYMHFHTLSTGKLILTILAEEPGLNAKQIYFRILRQGGKPISYQAVHKKLVLFEHEGIVSKNSHTFTISKLWLNEVTNLVETAKSKSESKIEAMTELTPIRQLRNHYETLNKDSNTFQEPFY